MTHSPTTSAGPHTHPSVRVGVIGVGNCARALLEGIGHYRHHPEVTAGLMAPEIGPYGPGDVRPVAAWDVDADKVGRTLWQARCAGQNLDVGIGQDGLEPVGRDVLVQAAPALDGLGDLYRSRVTGALTWDGDHLAAAAESIVGQIREARVDVLLNYLPVGSQAATEWWAERALEAGVAFVNCVPVFIAREPAWRDRFAAAGLPLIGDDIKSQLGATYLHRVLVRAFADRGVRLDRTYQLNVGGNMDFFNMLESDRLASKRASKSAAVTDCYTGRDGLELRPDDVHIGPSDYVPWLGDRKKAFIRCEGRGFAGAPIELEMQLTVPDSPNSAGVVIDAARVAKLALDRGDAHADRWVSAWLFKAPPKDVCELEDSVAHALLNHWINGGRRAAPGPEGAGS
ncbi:MAG: inositol-3-phosphate synthase [Nocardiopsaceae bacterium]|nr:inositol-3-phosphate synthase [Nocardiopsaceae bacterium]